MLNQCTALPKFSHSLEEEASNLNRSVVMLAWELLTATSHGTVAHFPRLEVTSSILKVFLAVGGKSGIALQLGAAWTVLGSIEYPPSSLGLAIATGINCFGYSQMWHWNTHNNNLSLVGTFLCHYRQLEIERATLANLLRCWKFSHWAFCDAFQSSWTGSILHRDLYILL